MKDHNDILEPLMQLWILHSEVGKSFIEDPFAPAVARAQLSQAADRFRFAGECILRCRQAAEIRDLDGLDEVLLFMEESDRACDEAERLLKNAAERDDALDRLCRMQVEKVDIFRREMAETAVRLKLMREKYLDVKRMLEELDD